jgi:hypothetical protein
LADNSFTHLVVVGSSAGGIAALSGMVSSLPEDFDAPIVVAQHLDPNRESHLQEILARKSTLPVKTVTEHEPLQAGMVYVVPANWHVNITDSEIELSSEAFRGQPMPSINLLMETAAGVYGENLIAVVLSGTGSDGTEGARTVSQAGGTVIIQDPETADFGEMPRSLAPSTVDIVASLEEIGSVLNNLISGIAVPEKATENEGQDLEHFLEELHRSRGVDFRSYKQPTIMRRLGRRMAATRAAQACDRGGATGPAGLERVDRREPVHGRVRKNLRPPPGGGHPDLRGPPLEGPSRRPRTRRASGGHGRGVLLARRRSESTGPPPASGWGRVGWKTRR